MNDIQKLDIFEDRETKPILEIADFQLKAYLLDGHMAVYFSGELDLFTLKVVIGVAEAQGYGQLIETCEGYLAFA